MARFDVFEDRDGDLFVDVRADRLEELGTYVLVPLIPILTAPGRVLGLNPILEFEGQSLVLMSQLIAATPRKRFRSRIGTLARYQDDITRALDVLLTGF